MSTLGTLQVSPLSFEQANPFLTGLQQGQNVASNNLNQNLLRQQIQSAANANKYQPQLLQQKLLASQYANQLAGANAQNADALAAAKLLQAQATPQLTQAQANQANAAAGFTGAQTNRFTQETPYDVQKAKANIYQAGSLPARFANLQQAGESSPYIADALKKSGLYIGPDNTVLPANQGQLTQTNPNVLNASPTGVPFRTADMLANSLPALPTTSNQQTSLQNTTGMQPAQGVQTALQNAPSSPQTGSQPYNPALPGTIQPGISPLMMYGATGNPVSQQTLAEQKGFGEATGKNLANNWNDVINNSTEAASSAKQANYNLDQFKANYDKTSFKGLLGKVPSAFADAAAQEADKAAAALQLNLANLVKNNRVTNYEEQRVMASLPGREMKPDAVNDITPFMKAKNEQLAESQKFFNYANKLGLKGQDAENLWQRYMEQRPVYDFNNREAPKYADDWHTFLTPQAINSMNQNGDYINIPKFNNVSDFNKWKNNVPDTVSGQVDKNIAATAKRYGHTPEQVEQEMIRRQGAQ